ncbi:S8 family serine peptidase [Allorhizocola rhizosphaerae]|uniref:S8 family serine peptidase n=1 Tax=Allorhizocola rhizosphaerae TaxID=1872709 RepID=UPI000E3ED6D4|nr:S8 family serine peptidase [Allorhizocola rhizosphaerae]
MRQLALATTLACLATTLAAATPQAAAATEQPPTVSATVRDAIATDGHTDFWILLDEQADLTAAAQVDGWADRGRAVYDALTATAARTQSALRTDLTAKGVEFQPFWAVNAIFVRGGTRAVLDVVVAHTEAAAVEPHGAYHLPEPQEAIPGAQDAIGWGVGDIRAPEVWDRYSRGEGVVVANIDTGVEAKHPALAQQYRGHGGSHDYNWYDPTRLCPAGLGPCDGQGHGTATMGVMAGAAPQERIGVAPGAQWIAARGCTDVACPFDTLALAGQWMLAPTDQSGGNPRPDLRPHVVNASWGWGAMGGHPWYREMVKAWVAAGIVPVFAAGNDGICRGVQSPASYPESIAVGAYYLVNGTHTIAPFSARGTSLLDGGIKPDVAAPGAFVRTAHLEGLYGTFHGTSLAAPHAAGAVALLLSAAPSLIGDVAGVRRLLESNAIDTPEASDPKCGGTLQRNNSWGEGRLDALSIVESAPRGPVGIVTGTVTAADGTPLAGAAVTLTGAATWTAATTADGTFTLPRVPVGGYSARVEKYGFRDATFDLTVQTGQTVRLDASMGVASRYRLSGVVTEGGAPLYPAWVSIADSGLPPVAVAQDGTFQIEGVPEGARQLVTEGGDCLDSSVTGVRVDGDEAVTIAMSRKTDRFGYTCRLVPAQWSATTAKVSELSYHALPFEFRFYGRSHTRGFATRQGSLSFPGEFSDLVRRAGPVPAATAPNSAVYPYWGDNRLVLSGSGSYWTGASGEVGNRTFTIEWRDLVVERNTTGNRVSVQVVLREDGGFLFQYQGIDPQSTMERGAGQSIGIENADGTDGIGLSYRQPVLSDAWAIEFRHPPLAYLSGTVTDANDGTPIPGARVTTASGSTVTGNDGRYDLQLRPGDYKVSIAANGYRGETFPAALSADRARVTKDVALATGRAQAPGERLETLLMPGETQQFPVPLSNTGSLPLNWSAAESLGNTTTVPGVVHSRWKRDGVFPTAVEAVGDRLWVYDENSRRLSEFTTDGTPTGRSHPAVWVEGRTWYHSFGADLAYDSKHGWLCHSHTGTDGRSIACIDPQTGAVQRELRNPGAVWANWEFEGLAYDPDTDTFIVEIGSWETFQRHAVRVAGFSHPIPGALVGQACHTGWPFGGATRESGLAYVSASQTLIIAGRSGGQGYVADEIEVWDLAACRLIGEFQHPNPGYHNGGVGVAGDGTLWAVDVSTQEVLRLATGLPSYAEVPWLSLDAAAGTLAQGGSRELTVTVDTTGLSPGVHDATVHLRTDGARTPRLAVPVRVVVPAYRLAVDAGGRRLPGWAADQKYDPDSGWGWQNQTRPVVSSRPIDGTDNDELYQTARLGDATYQFDRLPNGAYEIELHLAEIDRAQPGQRRFDVFAGETELLSNVDIAASAGTHKAIIVRAEATVVDGRLRLRLIGDPGSLPPLIAGIRLTHRPDRSL